MGALHPAVLVLALDGESVTGSNTGLAIISVVSMVFGYLLLAALWYFVFSNKARERRRKGKGPGE
jgi:peptidoglycan/LPS O-acetylase OafA/YrhL